MSTLANPAQAAPSDAADIADRLRDSVTACLNLLQDTVIESADQVSWPTWVLGDAGTPERCTAGRSSVYDGDAGIGWTLQRIGSAVGRPDVSALGRRAARAVRHRPSLPGVGLLAGRSGIALLDSAAELPGAQGDPARLLAAVPSNDLTDGLAGVLLAHSRSPQGSAELATALVDALWWRSERQLWGRGWPDPAQDGDEARPLCGMAHGASGIAWSLAEAARRWPALAESALSLAAEALRFESSWSDPLHGGWPDLRGAQPVWAARWCHGAAGAAAVRLRLLELSALGLVAPWSGETIRAELEVAVQACGAEVWREREAWAAYGADALGEGWTLCHGVGATAAVLDLAASALDEPQHRDLALDAARDFLDTAGDDPAAWPCGLHGADGDLALFNGIAGTAALFADLAGITGPGSGAGTDGPVVLLG
ncbi:lanthionine synthetase LanC family protein [Flexivirga oryzae]|uniref:Lanthionine synthetase n=1 Tax=Flexivirga oryzae TaxID=1794944 RepID=A0A839N995_9MICO|nr:lanthionine synthetase LanC family protein [Flexivirga oryzae]MBB2891775.1 hypothetical protein [Flexivirga oryzae]